MFTYLKIGGLVLAVALLFGAGWKTRDAFCDAAAAKLEIATLQKQIKASAAAAQQDVARAEAQSKELTELEERINDLKAHITDGGCLSESDVDWLRRIWPN